MKVHTMFVIGKRDMEADAVSVRVHGKDISAQSRAAKQLPRSYNRFGSVALNAFSCRF
jgi:hypothetical protein